MRDNLRSFPRHSATAAWGELAIVSYFHLLPRPTSRSSFVTCTDEALPCTTSGRTSGARQVRFAAISALESRPEEQRIAFRRAIRNDAQHWSH
jgi:hypothetical protein